MKKSYPFVLAFGLLFLFFIQMTGTLVESIYILDLMNTSLDEKVLGLLFFFTPVALLLVRKRIPGLLVWFSFGSLFLARGLTPYLNTLGRMLASGFGTGAALILFALLINAKPRDGKAQTGPWISAGLALAVGLSTLLRTANFGLDYSLTTTGGWSGWLLGGLFGYALSQMDWKVETTEQSRPKGLISALLGIFLVLTLVYFAFSAPAVIARWTDGNYTWIVSAVSLLALGWIWLALNRPTLLERTSRRGLLLWNLLFTLSLTGTILAQRVNFPQTPESAAVVVGAPGMLGQILLALMLLLFPVIFFDMEIFIQKVQRANPSPSNLVPGMLLGSLVLILLVFTHIFTNVWGYVEPVSPWFRNKFWLPYLLIAGIITLLIGGKSQIETEAGQSSDGRRSWSWAVVLGVIFLGTWVSALRTDRVQPAPTGKTSLVVMTYNIQQANDDFGEQSYERQLALIQQVSPDVLALQESDSARISLNNNDFVRYYASKLGYYSYYGPTTVTGTYGTALLSKYPLENMHVVFSYSDQDETGTTEAEIEVDGRRFNIYDVHPDGSDTAMLTWAKTLLERSQDKPYVIALGDYNLRDYEEAYQLIDSVYTNAWVSLYPSKISPNGTDMSGKNRIDHIFVSPSIQVTKAFYILPPDSATDHPVHWAELTWK